MKIDVTTGFYEQTQADLLFCPNDMLLRSTDPFAQVLARGAGPDLQRALDELVATNGAVPEGLGVVSPGFGLAAQQLFHGVLPVIAIRGAPSLEEHELFARTLRAFLMAAMARSATTIGIPFLASEKYGITTEDAMKYLREAGELDVDDKITCHVVVITKQNAIAAEMAMYTGVSDGV